MNNKITKTIDIRFNSSGAALTQLESENSIELSNLKPFISELDYEVYVVEKGQGEQYTAAIIFFNHTAPFQIQLNPAELGDDDGYEDDDRIRAVDKIVWHLDAPEIIENFRNNFMAPTKRESFLHLMSLPGFAASEIKKFLEKDLAIIRERHQLTNSIWAVNQELEKSKNLKI